MNRFCVQCGERNIPEDIAWRQYRCPPCWDAFKAAGGAVIRIVTPSQWAGVRTADISYKNHALYCRDCGGKLGMTRRVKFALGVGSECLTCDTCATKRKNAPYSSPSSDAPQSPQ